jgi:hypothetical protein
MTKPDLRQSWLKAHRSSHYAMAVLSAFGGDCGVASVDFSIDRGQPRRMSGRLLKT